VTLPTFSPGSFRAMGGRDGYSNLGGGDVAGKVKLDNTGVGTTQW
jgi:hypothetical protein